MVNLHFLPDSERAQFQSPVAYGLTPKRDYIANRVSFEAFLQTNFKHECQLAEQ